MNPPSRQSSFPQVGLGCMGMSEFYGPANDEESLRLLKRAFEIGYRHFDTADMYGVGNNERLVGRFLASLTSAERSEVLVATKCGIRRSRENPREISIDSSPAYLRIAVEASLERLGVEALDVLYLHRKSPGVPIEETVGEMGRLIDEGKIRRIGLSEVAPETLRRAHAIVPVACIQSEYSLWTRDPEERTFPLCEALGVQFVAYSPLGRGFFGKPTQRVWDGPQDLRAMLPRFQEQNLEQNLGLREQFAALCQTADRSMPELALAWVLRFPFVTAIPGSRRIEHLDSNFHAKDVALSDSLVAALDQLFAPHRVSGARYPEPLLATVNL